MPQKKIQFRHGMSLSEFIDAYGTEAKWGNHGVRESRGQVLFRASMPSPGRAEPDRMFRQSAARGSAAARDGERSEARSG